MPIKVLAVTTLSDDCGQQPIVVTQQEHRRPKRQHSLKKSECYGGYQTPVPSPNSAAIANGRLSFHQQREQSQQMQRQTLAELLKANNEFCNTYVEAHNKKKTARFGAAGEEFTGQFLCTFQCCKKRLKNNVMFMHHIWAHVAQQKPILDVQHDANGTDAATVDEKRSDVSRLLMCPECLLEQPTPHRARLHYHRVHKRGTRHLLDKTRGRLHVCNICEQVFNTETIASHCTDHHLPGKRAQLALPYGCRFSAGVKCQFRTSNRGALLRHFCFRHVGTRVVLCPFCLLTFSAPSADKSCSVVRMREFVKHMALHDGEKSLGCGLCVVKFPLSQRLLMGTHGEQHHAKHSGGEPKWKMQRMELNALVPDKSRALLAIPQCMECGQMVRCLAEHLCKERQRCSVCVFVTRCAPAMERHRLLSKCNAAVNTARIVRPFTGWTSPSTFALQKVNTSFTSLSSSSLALGQLSSVSVKALAEHIAKMHMLHQMATTTNGEQHQQQHNLIAVVGQHLHTSRDITEEEQHEAKLFGLRHTGDDRPLEEQRLKEALTMKVQDDTRECNDDGTAAPHESLLAKQRATVEKEMCEFRVRMDLVLDDFRCGGSAKTFSDKRPMKNGYLKAEAKD
ncbi:hypothetical protein niasHT_031842 [Heterodera trifolii]|uniref:C2H2-type domain-containing protein n=1 Tax=Heterodera trifolii TaxID=157864 RepID=A0ABD2IE80_9BILA